MPQFQDVGVEDAPTGQALLWTPLDLRSRKLKASSGLVGTYTTEALVLSECDWVYLQASLVAYQIHPATVAELAALGAVGGANAQRWTIEGPLLHRPGDPGVGSNCSIRVDVSTSINSASPGTNWRSFTPGRYRIRSAVARLTLTRPSTSYNWRVARFGLLGTRVAAPNRSRKVPAGVSDVVPSGMSRVVARDFEVLGSLEIEAGGILEILT